MPLTDEQIDRYSRQIILPEVGGRGQQRLLAARVLLADAGALGAWVARYLAATGVGELYLVGAAADSAASLRDLNPDCRIDVLPARVPGQKPHRASKSMVTNPRLPHTAVVGLGDETCAALAEECWMAGVPLVVAAVGHDGVGELTAVVSSHAASPCLRCAATQRIAAFEGGSGLVDCTAFVATIAATEALKLVLAVGEPLFGRRLRCDSRAQTVRQEDLGACPHRQVTGA